MNLYMKLAQRSELLTWHDIINFLQLYQRLIVEGHNIYNSHYKPLCFLIKDTEASVGDLQVPQVNPKIICGHVCLIVTVN